MLKVTQNIKRAVQFVQESKEELKKVTWPERDEVTSFTYIVIITVFFMAMFLWAIDKGLMALFKFLMN